jgi:biopolymer transport protein ExbD|nr:biopolymer transporter ExbD [Candidatus Acidoferrales bacterium]
MKFPSSLRPGIAVLLAAIAIYAIPIRWIETRRFTPLDVPFSASNGHFRTDEFKINLSGDYRVNFYRPYDGSPEYSNCPDDATSNTKWTVFRNGQPVTVSVPLAPGIQPWRRINFFRASPGSYSVDVEVLQGAECLNVARMQLVVSTFNNFQDVLDLLWDCCVFLAGVGIVLLILAKPVSFGELPNNQTHELTPISQSSGYLRSFGFRKRRPMPIFHRIPDFGMIFFFAMISTLIIMIILTTHHSVSMGIKARLTRPTGFNVNIDPRNKPLLVWIDADGKYFLNEKQITRNDLGNALKRELARRAEPTVYFEADGNAYFGDAAFAMSEIKNASGKLVWLTPKTRLDFDAQSAASQTSNK